MKIVLVPNPPREWSETVSRGLDRHNIAASGIIDFYRVGFLVLGSHDEIQGGLIGGIWGGWMQVAALWVSTALRGKGYGAALMARAHRYAARKRCTNAHLRTGSYEARPFYEKLGYSVYAQLPDHPITPHVRYSLQRPIRPEDDSDPPATKLRVIMAPYMPETAEQIIRTGISSHAHAAIGLPETERSQLNVFHLDDDGEILTGLNANVWGQWLYVDQLWVDAPMRGQGLGSELMRAAEKEAIARGCRHAFLGTFSFQARPLYEKLGYRVFGERGGYSEGHTYYQMKKTLG